MVFVPQHVFADRHRLIREYLAEEGLAALIVSEPNNFYMLSGFHLDVEPWERPVALVIPREAEPFLVMNELSTHHLMMAEERGSLFIRDYAIYLEHPRSFPRTHTRDYWAHLLAEKLRARGIKRGKVGVEGSGPAALKAVMPELEFVDVTRRLIRMREDKYPEELEIMRKCAELTDWAQDRYMELVKPGELVAAFDLKIAALMAEEGARRYPEARFEPRVFSLSGPASAAPHGTGADCGARFQEGDVVVNIIIGRLAGLVVENERTLFIGQPKNDLARRAFEAATAACEAAAAQMVAGNTVANADAAAQRVYEEAGFGEYIRHRTGHGMGIKGHEFPEDMPFNYRPFRENEVYSCEPGIYIYGLGGFRHDDTVIVGKERPEVITKRSKRLEDQLVPV
ncbi:MAG: Xaa-Pro peptidase family protein [Sphaerobacter sp.]|nr:Xaa-Pro peptidase family protein [Sphaerobacter sp.]